MQNVKKFVLLGCMAVMVAALAVVPARAQSASVSVNIPFDFVLAKQTLNAGTYVVERQGTFLSFRGPNGRSVYALPFAGSRNAKNGESYLVFTRYGNEAFLNSVVFSEDKNYDLPPSSREKELISSARSHQEAIRYAQSGQ